jgi:hypothetical protein
MDIKSDRIPDRRLSGDQKTDPTVAIFMVLWFFWAVFWFAVAMSGHGETP